MTSVTGAAEYFPSVVVLIPTVATMFRYKQERARAKEEAAKSGNVSSSSAPFASSTPFTSSSSVQSSPTHSSSSSSSSSPGVSRPWYQDNVFKTKRQYNNYKKTIFSRDPFAYMKTKQGTVIDMYDVDNKRYSNTDNRFNLGTSYSNSKVYTNGKEVAFASTSFNRNTSHCQKCKCAVTSEIARRTTYSYRSSDSKKFQPDKGDYRYSSHTCNHR